MFAPPSGGSLLLSGVGGRVHRSCRESDQVPQCGQFLQTFARRNSKKKFH